MTQDAPRRRPTAHSAVDLAVFDIAGTTVEEHSAVYRALADAVTRAGASPSRSDIGTWMGASKREAISALLTGADGAAPSQGLVDATFDEFRTLLAKAYAATPPAPMPGALDTFARLRDANVRIALTTGFDREVTTGLLDQLGWGADLLDAVVCIDDVTAGRPAPYMIFRAMELTGTRSVGRVLVAGDTVRDLEAGSNSGSAFVVGVLTGGVPRETLERAGHTHICPGIADVAALIVSE